MNKLINYFDVAVNFKPRIEEGMYFEMYEDVVVVHHNYMDGGIEMTNSEFQKIYDFFPIGIFTYLEPKFTGAEVGVYFIEFNNLACYITHLSRLNKFRKLVKNN